tara:strand:- start:332 stop:571 length:240 start_codon:yes stop_codon:yes gene_type:complete
MTTHQHHQQTQAVQVVVVDKLVHLINQAVLELQVKDLLVVHLQVVLVIQVQVVVELELLDKMPTHHKTLVTVVTVCLLQ